MTTPSSGASAAADTVALVGSPLTRVFVGTSGWADPLLRNTTKTAEMTAIQRALMNRRQSLVTSNYVLTEMLALLAAHRTHAGATMARSDILQYIEDIQALPWVQVTHVDTTIHQEAWRVLRTAPDNNWSWVDASSFVIMRLQGITHALTSDHHFAQAGFVPLPLSPP